MIWQVYRALWVLWVKLDFLWFLQLITLPGCIQAVPYSRDYKQKYEYFRKKLKKPVSVSSSTVTSAYMHAYSFYSASLCPLDEVKDSELTNVIST